VDDEDDASFSALQSSLGRIARKTGAAVLVTHHARNALSLYPAEPDVARRHGDFAPEDLFTLHHGKSTSSTRAEDSITLIRLGTKCGAVFSRPEDVEASPEQAAETQARTDRSRERKYEQLRQLYGFVESILPTRPSISPSYLFNERHADLGIPKRAMRALVETAMREGVLKERTRTAAGFVTLTLGHGPRKPIGATEQAA
jgi:hypothetical protein